MMVFRWILPWAPLIWLVSSSFSMAQTERYELGKRLRRFEIAWQQADPHLRTAAAKPMQKAVESFFSLRLNQAAGLLDEAYFVTRSTQRPTTFERLLISHRVDVEAVAVELSNCEFKLKLLPLYNTDVDETNFDQPLGETEFQISILDHEGHQLAQRTSSGSPLMSGISWKPEKLPEGDYTLDVATVSPAEQVKLPAMAVSVVSEPRARLAKLDAWLKQPLDKAERSDESDTIRLSIRQYVQTVRAQLDGRSLETDYPAARLLKLAENLAASPSSAAELCGREAETGLWMTLSHQRRNVNIRIQTPTQVDHAKAEKRPILIAFHGAGGSENMFFETYGAGRLVELAIERGWIVVAPGQPLLGMSLSYREMLDVLRHFFPIDDQRVYLVGHSMGAAEVVRQVSSSELAPQAAAAIGGGGRAKDTASLKATPWFIAAGQLDFGRSGAKSLSETLERLDCRCQYHEYPDVEHMVIVQASLDDTFAFLDQHHR